MLFEGVHGGVGGFEGVIDVLLVVWVTADDWSEIACNWWKNFRVQVGHPSNNGGVVLLGLA